MNIPCGSTVRVIAECLHEINCKIDDEYLVHCCPQPPVTILVTDANTGAQYDVTPDPDTGAIPKIPPGDYKLIVTSPTQPAGLRYDWTLWPDDSQNDAGPEIVYTLPDGQLKNIFVSVTLPGSSCPPLAGGVTLWASGDCPAITTVKLVSGCAPGDVQLTVEVSNESLVGKVLWDFGDGSPPEESTPPNSLTTSHTYSNPGNYNVKVTLTPTDSECAVNERVFPVQVPKCNGEPPKWDGFSWCCVAAWIWLTTFVSIWFVTEIWQAAASAAATSTVALIVWFAKCQECGWKVWTKKYWKCINPFTNCCFLRWTILGHEMAIFMVVWAIYFGYEIPAEFMALLVFFLGVWSGLWSKADCKSYPILFRPKTWPPCKCKR